MDEVDGGVRGGIWWGVDVEVVDVGALGGEEVGGGEAYTGAGTLMISC